MGLDHCRPCVCGPNTRRRREGHPFGALARPGRRAHASRAHAQNGGTPQRATHTRTRTPGASAPARRRRPPQHFVTRTWRGSTPVVRLHSTWWPPSAEKPWLPGSDAFTRARTRQQALQGASGGTQAERQRMPTWPPRRTQPRPPNARPPTTTRTRQSSVKRTAKHGGAQVQRGSAPFCRRSSTARTAAGHACGRAPGYLAIALALAKLGLNQAGHARAPASPRERGGIRRLPVAFAVACVRVATTLTRITKRRETRGPREDGRTRQQRLVYLFSV